MMRDAALNDFAQVPDIEICITCDERLPAPSKVNKVVMVGLQQEVWSSWERLMASSDAVLIIAPETDGVLAKLTQLAERLNKLVLGCKAFAIELAGDKWLSYQRFISHHIPTLETYLATALLSPIEGPFVAKRRDGAGCDDIAIFKDIRELRAGLIGRELTHIVQPYQKGEPASFSMLCKNDKAYLLSCNRQHIENNRGRLSYLGGVLNDMDEHREAFNTIAQKIIQAIPGLNGYVGVDLIVHQSKYFVLEVNPRLTTSYVALHQACGFNPAQLLLDLFYNESFTMPEIAHHKIEISINASVLTN